MFSQQLANGVAVSLNGVKDLQVYGVHIADWSKDIVDLRKNLVACSHSNIKRRGVLNVRKVLLKIYRQT